MKAALKLKNFIKPSMHLTFIIKQKRRKKKKRLRALKSQLICWPYFSQSCFLLDNAKTCRRKNSAWTLNWTATTFEAINRKERNSLLQ